MLQARFVSTLHFGVIVSWRLPLFAFAALIGLLASTVAAQSVTDDPVLDELRRRAPSGAADEKIIDDFLAAQITKLTAKDASPATGQAFRDLLKRVREASDTTQGFRDVLATRLGLASKAEFDKSQALSASAAETLVHAMLDARDKRTAQGFAAALAHPDAAIRYLGAKGLQVVRDTLVATPDNEIKPIVEKLQPAGVAETNAVVVDRIYLALSFTQPAPEAFEAQAAILEARVDRYRKTGVMNDTAEVTLLNYLTRVQVPSAPAATIVRHAATLLRLDVERFAALNAPGASAGEADAIAGRIDACERFIKKVTGLSGGDIGRKMQSGDVAAAVQMKLELLGWIGSAQEDGALTAAPWSVPRGAP